MWWEKSCTRVTHWAAKYFYMITQVKFQCVTHHNTECGNRQDWIGREINNPFTAPWRGPPLFVKRNLLFFEVRQTKKKKNKKKTNVFCLTPVEVRFQGRHSLIKALSLQHQGSHTLPPHSLFTPAHSLTEVSVFNISFWHPGSCNTVRGEMKV